SILAPPTSLSSTSTTASARRASPLASTGSNKILFLLLQQNFQYAGPPREANGRWRVQERKCARDERRRIEFSRLQQHNSLAERAAARADDSDFLHNDRPSFHRLRTVKRGLEHKRTARLGNVLC